MENTEFYTHIGKGKLEINEVLTEKIVDMLQMRRRK
jgi:hypothetical protein